MSKALMVLMSFLILLSYVNSVCFLEIYLASRKYSFVITLIFTIAFNEMEDNFRYTLLYYAVQGTKAISTMCKYFAVTANNVDHGLGKVS